MAQQTFSGVPGDFTAGQVLTAAEMDKLREFLLYLIKDGDEGDTGEVSPVIMDLGNDRVGINTVLPYESLDVYGNIGFNAELTAVPHYNGNAIGYINFHGYQGGADQYRDLGIYNGRQGRLMLFDGSTGVVHCDNEFTAGTKTFDIAHPTRGGDWRLRHASVEGPRHDLIYRGTVTLAGGTATVDLDTASGMTDGTWEALCRDPWSLVASSGNAVEWVLDGSTLTITSSTADAVCNWLVMAERHDDQVKGDQAPSADDDGHLVTEYERDEREPDTPPE